MSLQFPVQALKCQRYRRMHMLLKPFFHNLSLHLEFLLTRLDMHSVFPISACTVTECESQKVECFRLAILAVFFRESAKGHQFRFFHRKFQLEPVR